MFQTRKPLTLAIALIGAAALLAATFANADDKKATLTKGQPEMKAPPGMNPADMMACMEAGKVGPMHAFLQKMVGTWNGKTQMWMGPDMPEPMNSECTQTIAGIMDGRFVQCDMVGQMPGMGEFKGRGTTGYDNVSGKFVSTWIDSFGTGIMTGTGERSADGKTMKWEYTYNCPITKKEAVMKITENYTSADAMSMSMYMKEPRSGKEYKHMHIELTRAK